MTSKNIENPEKLLLTIEKCDPDDPELNIEHIINSRKI
jgi:hypothetical protein